MIRYSRPFIAGTPENKPDGIDTTTALPGSMERMHARQRTNRLASLPHCMVFWAHHVRAVLAGLFPGRFMIAIRYSLRPARSLLSVSHLQAYARNAHLQHSPFRLGVCSPCCAQMIASATCYPSL